MHVLETRGLPLPEIVVVDPDEVAKIRRSGLPYVVRQKKWSDEKILKSLLYGVISKMFPYLRLNADYCQPVYLVAPQNVLTLDGYERIGGSEGHPDDTERLIDEQGTIVERNDYRYTSAQLEEYDADPFDYDTVSLEKRWQEGAFQVDVTELMDAGLLPKFLQDIGEAIRANLSSYMWIDCWNRKLNADIGEFRMVEERPNLIVLDISGSIPAGIAYTMIGLIDTLRSQCNADLIVNSGSSQWWPKEEDIDLNKINAIIGGCNEARQFYKILEEHVIGKKWGNVIGFGDDDAPHLKARWHNQSECVLDADMFKGTEIGNVVGYHTTRKAMPGYLLWTRDCKVDHEELGGCGWAKQVRRY